MSDPTLLSERDLDALASAIATDLATEIETEAQRRATAYQVILSWAEAKSAQHPDPRGDCYRGLIAVLRGDLDAPLPSEIVQLVRDATLTAPASAGAKAFSLTKKEYN
jgi:hypothetical protein